MGRHDDQPYLLVMGELHDAAGGVAFKQHGTHVEAGQLDGGKRMEVFFHLRRAGGIELGEHRPADFERSEFILRRRDHVQQHDFGTVMGSQQAGVARRAERPFGKIDRKKQPGERLHENLRAMRPPDEGGGPPAPAAPPGQPSLYGARYL